jgi:predicted lipid-binding transport protein (Tim44 family)
MPDNLTNPTPQFSTAEYPAAPGIERCQSCKQTLGSQYYRVNGALTCAYCAEQTKLRLPKDSHEAFVRGLIFGIGGAILGLVIYSGFGIITGLMIGYVSLAVGYIVGKAIMKGSKGIGGRRYQITAVALTYAAVSLAAVPISISQMIKEEKAKKEHVVQHSSPKITDAQQASDTTPEAESSNEEQMPAQSRAKIGLGAALGWLTLVGLASPFLELQDPIHGVIGLVILLVGIRIAWSLTAGAKVDILGPFKTTQPASS